MLAEKTEKVCEMAAVMKEALKMDEENCHSQQELMARLVTENKVEQIINYSLKARIAFFGFNSKSRLKYSFNSCKNVEIGGGHTHT